MSCFVVSDDTLRVIALESTQRVNGVDIYAARSALRTLHDANVRAFADRYVEALDKQVHYACPTISHADVDRLGRPDPVVVLKAVQCYAYQASDWAHWSGSQAAQIAEAASCSALRRLPGYDDAPWGDL